ncbi:MAG TPA: LAGLIDADG family homing endonuclease [Aggregatilineales bacterium]|nr:LAGLIDADG family homing endonuclease [Aggregatilineales bacterium]
MRIAKVDSALSGTNSLPPVPLPDDLRAQTIHLTDNARTVLQKRYLRRGNDGKPAETEHEMFWRVAYYVAVAEQAFDGDVMAAARRYFDLLTGLQFFPNSPTFSGAGTPLGQLAACFVLAIDDDMGRTDSGIFQTLRNAALIQQTGGGNGFAFSRLRPKGAIVNSSRGEATGPVGFLRVYDQAFGEIAQGGCLTPDTLVFTEKGLLRLDEIVTHTAIGWDEHEITVPTDEGDRHSGAAYNNGAAPVLRIHTDEGLELTGTPNHKIKVMTDTGPVWRAFEELQAGDAILVKLGQHRGHNQPLRTPQKQHGNQIMPVFPALLDQDFAFFLGYMAGDGFMASAEDDHRIGVTVAHTSYLFSEMPAMMHRLFGEHLTVHVLQQPNDASATFVLDNRAIKDFFILNGLTKERSLTASVPRLIRQSPPNVVGAFLRGLFEADGSPSHGYPSLMSSSKTLIHEVATLLIGLGCPVTIRRQTINETHYGENPMWMLRINSSVGLAIWQEKIACDLRSRFQVSMELIPDRARESSYSLPNPAYWVTPVLDGITLPQTEHRARGMGRNFRAVDSKLRKKLLRYTRGDRQLTLSGYAILSEAHAEFAQYAHPINDSWFVRVIAVEPAGESLTLDLEVDDNHTYLANGIVTHNSRRGANMAVLKVNHPDIREFITSKTDESKITNFNISVGITDEFMEKVQADGMFDLINPHDGKVWETVRAREIFDLIVQRAHHNGEPGVLFLDAANRANPVPHLYELESTNPCFVGSTRVATDRGLVTIKDLAESEQHVMVATDGRAPFGGNGRAENTNYGIAYRASTPAWLTRRNTPVLKLTTNHGYTVTATPDHKFLTPDRGYVELSQLKPHDSLLLQSGEGAWSKNYALPNTETVHQAMALMAMSGDHKSGHTVQRQDFADMYNHIPSMWSHELGIVLGFIVGDGWVSPDSGSPLGMVFDKQANDVRECVHGALKQWFGDGHLHERESVWQLTYGKVPYTFFTTLGVLHTPAHEKQVPGSIWNAPREAVVGFLQGLFSADGTVGSNEAEKSCSVRLASSSKPLLEDVQRLLVNFGIVSKIHHRRSTGYRRLPDGQGGYKDYLVHDDYELILDKANRDRYVEIIGFIDGAKQAKVTRFITGKARKSNRENFITKILSIEDAGTADVYDLTEPQTHSVIVNGLVAHQCGEQFLGAYENCCLGSINLAKLPLVDGQPDWNTFQAWIETSTRFLDDVVTANSYVPSVPQLSIAAQKVRRIGLGIMGLADLMYRLGVRYGSEEGQEFAGQISEFLRYHAMRTSIELAKDRGAFPAIKGSIYDPENLKWQPPTPLFPYSRNWGRPKLDWAKIVKGIKKHGIRNGAQTTVAPTGTIATVSGCEGYGCEPVFALAYIRHVNDKGRDLQLQYTSPLFEKALHDLNLPEHEITRIVTHVNTHGTCQDAPNLPDSIRHTFVVSSDVTATEHIRMQAAMQCFVDNAISKCVSGDTLVLTASGLTPISELSEMRLHDQFEPLTMDVVTPCGVEKTDAFFYGGMRETRKVHLSYGFKLEGTPNHRVHVLGKTGAIQFVRLDELTIGDTVVLYGGQQVFGDAKQLLPGFNMPKRHHQKFIKFPERMSTELAYILGCITSEGAIGKNGTYITNGDYDLLDRLGLLFTAVFGLTYHISKDTRRESVYTLQVNSRPLRDWLLTCIGMEAGARNKIIPTPILRGSRSEIAAFLRGLFLDAYMTRDGRMFGIGLATRRLLQQLQVLFLNFGVIGRIHKGGPNAWALTVAGSSLELLASFIEFDEVWKTQRISIRHEGREQRVHTYAELMPRELTLALRRMQQTSKYSLRSLYGEQTQDYQRARVNLLQNHRMDRDLAKAIYSHFSDAIDPFAKGFFGGDKPECLYVEVEAIDSGFSEVYDLSVPGSHTFVASGLGNHNTCNFPSSATLSDVAEAYQLGWKLGCKGLTVYVTGSREKVVLETHATAKAKDGESAPVLAAPIAIEPTKPAPIKAEQKGLFYETKKPRPRRLQGRTYRVGTPLGGTYVTINENGHGEGNPFELFIHTSKAGSETAAVSEAIGRLSSLILRMASPLAPRERVREILKQLEGIGGERSIGFGSQRVRSLPDGVAQALREYLDETDAADQVEVHPVVYDADEDDAKIAPMTLEAGVTAPKRIIGDLCPECGEASVVNEEGCRKCYNCGYSEC